MKNLKLHLFSDSINFGYMATSFILGSTLVLVWFLIETPFPCIQLSAASIMFGTTFFIRRKFMILSDEEVFLKRRWLLRGSLAYCLGIGFLTWAFVLIAKN